MMPLSEERPTALGTENPFRLAVVGAASPLWLVFAGAAASGAAYWWMTRWARPVNLEAIMGAASQPAAALPEPAEALPEPEPAAVELAPEPAPIAQADVLERPPEPPAVEAIGDAVVNALADATPPNVLALEPESAATAKPKAKAARSPLAPES